MRLTMMLNQLPITYDSQISKTLRSIIKLRTEELRKQREQCHVLSMSHDDSMNQMTDEYNIDHLESDYLAAGIPERFRLDNGNVESQGPRQVFCIKRSVMQEHGIYGYTS